MKKTITLASILLISGFTMAAPAHNQNIGFKLSEDSAKLNYDFRIPNQRLFAMNDLYYHKKTDRQLVSMINGFYLKEKNTFGSFLSIGGGIKTQRDILTDHNSAAIGFFMGLSDSSKVTNSFYYDFSLFLAPSILTFNAENLANSSIEMGIHLTPGSTTFIGYDVQYMQKEENEHDFIHYPYVGFSIDF